MARMIPDMNRFIQMAMILVASLCGGAAAAENFTVLD